MRILVTGASGNVGKGIIPRLQSAGHDLVLYDLMRLPDRAPFAGTLRIQGDIQAGVGIDRAAAGCDLILHTPAWHGIHWGEKTEVDFWRLNVDGTFWMFQAAKAAGVKRVVFLSSQAWHGHYDKYGFTKRVGEELCEYYRRNHGIRYVAVRPYDFTPWGSDWVNRYGSRLLYGGVDREDVLDCVDAAVEALKQELPEGKEPEAVVAAAQRASAFTTEQAEGWEQDPLSACERVFPGSRQLVERYNLAIQRQPSMITADEGATSIGFHPRRHFGTFLEELRQLDAELGEEGVRALTCPY